MELLAGAKDEPRASELKRMLLSFDHLAFRGLDDYEQAAALYRHCRRKGLTVRSMTDCLIAAVAIRCGAAVLHQDRDFDAIAQHTALNVAR